MLTVAYIRSRSGSRDGVALLAVLAFVLLLTILIVSFISYMTFNRLSTVSYGSAVQAEEIAHGGLQDILGDLHQEIVAGSIPDPNGTTYTQPSGGTTIYVPSTNLTAVPARLGYTTNSPYSWTNGPAATTTLPATAPTRLLSTLVRVSRASQDPTPTDLYPALNSTVYGNLYPNKPNGGVVINRASKVSTGMAALNGRYISPARWNKPYLLAPTTALIPTPFYGGEPLPLSTYPSTPDLPDWVYVTRTGSRVCNLSTDTLSALTASNNLTQNYSTNATGQNPPASPVIGRYAYVVYDEGALLDANVAGSPSSLMNNSTVVATAPTTTPAPPLLPIYTNSSSATPPIPTSVAFTGKSYLSFADLMQLPGFFGGGSSAQTIIDNLVNLRNAGGIANANTSYGNGYTGTGTSYLGAIFNYAQNGFMQFQSTTGHSPISDSPFLSRQDLINYFAKIDANINTSSATYSQALPYLGTYSRAVSAPSYTPPLDSSAFPTYKLPTPPSPPGFKGFANTAPVAYKDNAENTGIANRDFANVRFANAGTITHYLDDQTSSTPTETYSVNAGDPLLQNRFSLARINWLSSQDIGGADAPGSTNPATGNGPSSGFATAIKSCFGLVWEPPGNNSKSTANGGNPCWNYVGSPVGPSGSAQVTINGTNAVIETLDQVAQEGREPNFFELLKAAILSGSLGLGPGPAAFQNGSDNSADTRNVPFDCKNPPGYNQLDILGGGSLFSYTFGPGSSVKVPQLIPDIQIMQIGANIIDQYDSDSYPTAIYFPYNGVGANDPVSGTLANAVYGPVDMVYGDENLPDLTKVVSQICSPDPADPNDSTGNGNAGAPSQDDNTHSLEGWLQPELWNPHQMPVSPLPNVIHNFEIRAYGNAMTYASIQGGWLAPAPVSPTPPNGWSSGGFSDPASKNWSLCNSNIQSYYPGVSSSENPTSGVNEKTGTIDFVDSSTTSSFYSTPRMLVATGDSGSITGLTSVTSPLPTPAIGSAAGTTASNVALTTFPYYQTGVGVGLGSGFNHFIGFSAGLISEAKGTSPPFMSYYVGSSYENAPIYGPNVQPPPSNYNAPGAQTGIGFPFVNGPECVSFALGWLDGSGGFHPYSFITGGFETAYLSIYDDAGHSPDGRVGAVANTQIQLGGLSWGNIDPRTGRLFAAGNFIGGGFGDNSTPFPNNSGYSVGLTGGVPALANPSTPGAANVSTGNFTSPQPNGYIGNGGTYPADWMMNAASISTTQPLQRTGPSDPRNSVTPTSPAYYADPDGVVRPGDGLWSDITTGNGMFTFISGTNVPATGSAVGDTTLTGDTTGNNEHGRRPVILNRPFRSVGELGYVFRDLPFKTLDFFTTSSADAALLDVFSLTDESKVSSNQMTSVIAGQVDLSNAPLPVMQALLSGGSKKDLDPTYDLGGLYDTAFSSEFPTLTELPSLSTAIVDILNPTAIPGPNAYDGPLINRAALVTQVNGNLQGIKSVTTYINGFPHTSPKFISPFSTSADEYNKAYLESPVRALADVTNTRTWNLLIDIIAQSGQISPNATSLANFAVQGEKRYWLHVAIDRYTGKIVAQQLEPVYE